MSVLLGDAIEVTGAMPAGVCYKFPQRSLGHWRFVVWLAVWIVLEIAYWMLCQPIERVVQNGLLPGNLFSVVVWGGLTFLLLRFALWFCLALLFGHCEVELNTDSLRVGERIGFLRPSKRWPLSRLKQLQIVDLLGISAIQDSELGLIGSLYVLTGVLEGGKRISIAPGYPRTLLDLFVEDLSSRTSVALAEERDEPAKSMGDRILLDHDPQRLVEGRNRPELDDARAEGPAACSSSPPIGRIEVAPPVGVGNLIADAAEAIRKLAEPDLFEQPAGSDVQVEVFDEGITLRIPPAGIWKGSAGLFQGGILFGVISAGFTILFLVAGIAQGGGLSGVVGTFVVMSVFWLASGFMLFQGWRMGTRESAVAVAADRMMVIQTGLRHTRQRQWNTSEIKTVRVGPSGIEVNDRPVMELQIHGAEGKLFGMLAGRDERELTWMATLLRQTLRKTVQSTPESVAPGEGELPA
jgi:hypothetical protein